MSTTAPATTGTFVVPESEIKPRGLMQRLVFRKLRAFERASGVSADYARYIANVSLRAFFKFAKLAPLASYRRALPADACSVAQLVAARDEDCGPCVQIGLNFALQQGVPREILRSALDRHPDELPPKLADVYRFAEVVVSGGEDDELRQRIISYYGEEALVEMGLAMAVGRTFPLIKRTLGYAKSCALMPPRI